MSYWKNPIVAAIRAVDAPTSATIPPAVGLSANKKFSRAIM